MTDAALGLLSVLSMLSLPFWWDVPMIRRFRLRAGVVLFGAATLLGAVAFLAVNSAGHDRAQQETAVVLCVLASLVSGGPVTLALLRLADHGTPAHPQGPARAGVLTGGAWIGALERLAITTTLLARWPEGLVLVLAVKGLGRYPELHNAGQADQSGTAERFIIGTFTSCLWAAACAGIGLDLLR